MSTSDTGWALYENAVLADYDSISFKKTLDSDIRYDCMLKKIMELLYSIDPHIIVIEKPPYKSDPQALFKLSKLIGAVNGFSLSQPDFVDYVEYGPNEWRSFVKTQDEKIPIKRDICKAWDLDKVNKLFGISLQNDNIADAILIGYARIIEWNKIMGVGK